MNHVLERILELLEHKKWTKYKLAKESGIPMSSLNSLFGKNNQPTIATLEKICDGLHITMSEFFTDSIPESKYPLSDEEAEILSLYKSLGNRDKRIIQILLTEMNQQVTGI